MSKVKFWNEYQLERAEDQREGLHIHQCPTPKSIDVYSTDGCETHYASWSFDERHLLRSLGFKQGVDHNYATFVAQCGDLVMKVLPSDFEQVERTHHS